MAQIATTFSTYDAIGIREDLSNVIYNISPEDTPFMSNAGRGKCKNTFYEWQQDALAAAAANHQIEGDDVASFAAVVPTSRVGNRTQISRKTLLISETEEAVDKAGRKSEEAYQLAKLSAELKRDMEFIMLSNQASVAGNDTTARQTGSLLAFVKTNDNFGAGGASPVYTTEPNAARTDGTQRAWTEALLKDVIQLAWTEGAAPDTVMVGSFNKGVTSGFAGIATKTLARTKAEPTAIIGSADIYVSDFGTLDIIANRFQRARDAHVIDFDYVSVEYLRPFKRVALAKTGDADKKMLIVEWGLKVKNEKALALSADLNTA